MKAKMKDEINKFKLTCTHKELIIFREALRSYDPWEDSSKNSLNRKLWDCDEVKNLDEVQNVIDDILVVIESVQEDINVY